MIDKKKIDHALSVLDAIGDTPFVTVGFSCGKDSVVCMELARRVFKKVVPIHFYWFPDLDVSETALRYYENLFKTEIVRLPHPGLYDLLRHQSWQPLHRVKYLDQIQFPRVDFNDLRYQYLGTPEDEYVWDIVGLKRGDGFNRAMVIKKSGYFNMTKHKVYPIGTWTHTDCFTFLADLKYKLPRDYAIWGQSFDGFAKPFLLGLKKFYPKDFEKVKQVFPFLEMEVIR